MPPGPLKTTCKAAPNLKRPNILHKTEKRKKEKRKEKEKEKKKSQPIPPGNHHRKADIHPNPPPSPPNDHKGRQTAKPKRSRVKRKNRAHSFRKRNIKG
jgi:hypothetical protein